ncbi:hypothetical protein llap_15962 [Limosa lapponica baueri]|uniref:B(0,+)-type amino acid transporter 1 n=1 Tax=Limosa lapponica baueri TaxID=1758121 RepID=A0A2I0TIU9_LIMLA|nr:hypothetical protein llap_15962 [Limosa lapponica baueri]
MYNLQFRKVAKDMENPDAVAFLSSLPMKPWARFISTLLPIAVSNADPPPAAGSFDGAPKMQPSTKWTLLRDEDIPTGPQFHVENPDLILCQTSLQSNEAQHSEYTTAEIYAGREILACFLSVNKMVEHCNTENSTMRKRKTTDSPHSSTDPSEGKEKLRLKQEVGLISGVSLIAGTMIGSGIFMSPEWVLHHMGSPASSLLVWAACGLLAMFGALSYAELGTIIKESGGEYIYILRIFGSFPAFLFAYTSVILVRPAGLAAVCLSFAEYAVAPFYPGCSSPQVVIKCTAAACIVLLTVINCLNVRLATSIMNVFTAAKLLALLVIVVGGVVLLAKGQTQSFQNAFQNTTAGIGAVGVAFYQGLWSYDGWNNLNYVTEELKKPESAQEKSSPRETWQRTEGWDRAQGPDDDRESSDLTQP